jgi:hypothetical protein
MSDGRRTTTFYVGEVMFEHSKSFEEATRYIGMPTDEIESLKSEAEKHHVSINDHMKTVTFYNKSKTTGRVLRWWLSKSFVEQLSHIIIYTILLCIFVLYLLFVDDGIRHDPEHPNQLFRSSNLNATVKEDPNTSVNKVEKQH